MATQIKMIYQTQLGLGLTHAVLPRSLD